MKTTLPIAQAHPHTDRVQRRTRLLLLAGVSLAMLGGTAAQARTPKAVTPAVTVSEFHNRTLVTAQDGAVAPALDSWWSGFNDPVLTTVVERALAQNLDLAASLARVEQASSAAARAGANRLPSGTVSASAGALHQSLESPIGAIGSQFPGFDRDVERYDVGAGATWELDLAGGLKAGQKAAIAEAKAAEAAHAGVRVTIAAEAADAYFLARGYQARLSVAQDQVKTDEKLLELVQLRKTYGAATDREIAQSQALLAHARAAIPPLRIGLEAQLNRLDVLMGAQPGTYASELSGPAAAYALPAITTAEPASALLRRRPDIIAAENRLAASDARIKVATAQYYPSFSLSGLLGFQSNQVGDLLKGDTFQPQAAFGLHWRLFDFGRIDADVAQAKGARAEALAVYRKSILRSTEDVENAFMAFAQLHNENIELVAEEEALVRARDLAQSQYTGGSISLTDVLDADRQLMAVRDALAQNQADTSRAAVASFRALGGGW